MAVATGPSKSDMTKSSVLLPRVESATCWARWSALLASVRSDEERWSFLLLLPLAGVTAGALTSSFTPDIESL